MRRRGKQDRLTNEHYQKPRAGRHPRLRHVIAETVHVIDVPRLFGIRKLRASRRHPEIADQDECRVQRDPQTEGASIIPKARDQIEQEERQPPVEERNRKGKPWDLRIEHVVGHSCDLQSKQMRVQSQTDER